MATLLLIDPNPATRSVLRTLLTDAGHHVEGVGSLIAARGVLARVQPALLLLDLTHSRANEMLQAVQSVPADARSIVLLVHPDEAASLPQHTVAGGYPIIDRGLADDALLEQINRHLAGGVGQTNATTGAAAQQETNAPSQRPATRDESAVIEQPVAPLAAMPTGFIAVAGPESAIVTAASVPASTAGSAFHPESASGTTTARSSTGGASRGDAPALVPAPQVEANHVQELPAAEGELESLYKDVGFNPMATCRTLLYCDLHHLSGVTATLSAAEQNEVLMALLSKLEQAILVYDGRVCVASRNGFAVLFDISAEEEAGGQPFHAAIEMVYIAQQFCNWLRHRYPGRGRQDFAISIALDTGDFDLEDGVSAVADPDMNRAITRAAQYAALGGRRGWTLTATAQALESAGQTCSAGDRLAVRDEENGNAEIFEVGAVALDSTSSVHERMARILQNNSALLRHGGAAMSPREDSSAGARTGPSIEPAPRARAPQQPQVLRPTTVATTAPADSAEVVPRGATFDVPGYRVLRPLGKGGMAEVFLATHLATGDERVLKMLPINDGEEEQLQRFIQEYALISQIRDPNVARIHEQGFTQTHAYIAMEFLPGGELRAAMKEAVSVEQTLIWMQAIAGALVAVHAKDIAHRDLKPANLMFRADGSLVLADFGIAKGQSDLLNRTANGHIVGSPYYLSPEQAESKQVDARCDLYSLGIILFEMLTGKKPFRASNLSDLIRQHVVAPIPRLPEALAEFQPLIDRLLAKLPSDRISSARLVLDELKALRAAVDRTETGATLTGTFTSAATAARVMREVYSVAVIGFDETEKIVLSSTLGLSVRRKPRFIEFDGGRADRPDIYLVDARDLLYLQTMLASNLDRAVPTVLIGSSDFGTGWPVLKRPLQWAKIFEAFDRALQAHEAGRHAAVS